MTSLRISSISIALSQFFLHLFINKSFREIFFRVVRMHHKYLRHLDIFMKNLVKVDDSNEWKAAKKTEKEVVDLIAQVGGTITGEHGIGLIKSPFVPTELGNSLDIMRAIKQLFDSNGILNAGKLCLDKLSLEEPPHSAYSKYTPE
ncbi:MAG: FAD-linked oxidase C-terminal domain-containing protein [Promethearchaeota archaeon]